MDISLVWLYVSFVHLDPFVNNANTWVGPKIFIIDHISTGFAKVKNISYQIVWPKVTDISYNKFYVPPRRYHIIQRSIRKHASKGTQWHEKRKSIHVDWKSAMQAIYKSKCRISFSNIRLRITARAVYKTHVWVISRYHFVWQLKVATWRKLNLGPLLDS